MMVEVAAGMMAVVVAVTRVVAEAVVREDNGGGGREVGEMVLMSRCEMRRREMRRRFMFHPTRRTCPGNGYRGEIPQTLPLKPHTHRRDM